MCGAPDVGIFWDILTEMVNGSREKQLPFIWCGLSDCERTDLLPVKASKRSGFKIIGCNITTFHFGRNKKINCLAIYFRNIAALILRKFKD